MTKETTSPIAGRKTPTVLEGPKAIAILRAAELARSPDDLQAVIAELESLTGKPVMWKELGGEGRVTHSVLGGAAQSTHLLGEPVINFFDAALQMKYELQRKQGDDSRPPSMKAAATKWFDVPEDGLAAWEQTGEDRKKFNDLAKRSQIFIRSGSSTKTPTVVFRDHWIGQHPSAHEDTILSLQKGMKAEIPFLAGQYGHGAGFTFAFSYGGQILISRRHPELLDDDQDDLVGLSIVKRRMPSEDGNKNPHPSYWYAVCPDTQQPFAFRSSALEDSAWHGLSRVCIDYEMKSTDIVSIWGSLDHNLPDPAMPYSIVDERPDPTTQAHYLSGNAARLQRHHEGRARQGGKNKITVRHRRSTRIDLTAFVGDGKAYGSFGVTVSLVEQEGNRKVRKSFSPADEAEVWTLHGQRHHARTGRRFGQKPILLDAIHGNLLVEVKLDELSMDAKAMTLTSDRQGAAERDVRFQIENAIDNLLAEDEDLGKINGQVRDAALQEAIEGSDSELRKALEEFQLFVDTETRTKKKKGKRRRNKNDPPNIKPLEPISPLLPHPTFLRFRKAKRKNLYIPPGKTSSVLLEANAIDGYFGSDRNPEFNFHPDPDDSLSIVSTDVLKDGRMRVRVRAKAVAPLGVHQLVASYLPARENGPLTADIDIEIGEPRPKKPGKGPKANVIEDVEEPAPTAPPNMVIYEHQWVEKGFDDWDKETVGEYKAGVAYVNGDHRPFKKLMANTRTSQQGTIKALYVAPIVMTLVSLEKQEQDGPKDDAGEVAPVPDAFMRAALRSAALSSLFTIRQIKKSAGTMDRLVDDEDDD